MFDFAGVRTGACTRTAATKAERTSGSLTASLTLSQREGHNRLRSVSTNRQRQSGCLGDLWRSARLSRAATHRHSVERCADVWGDTNGLDMLRSRVPRWAGPTRRFSGSSSASMKQWGMRQTDHTDLDDYLSNQRFPRTLLSRFEQLQPHEYDHATSMVLTCVWFVGQIPSLSHLTRRPSSPSSHISGKR